MGVGSQLQIADFRRQVWRAKRGNNQPPSRQRGGVPKKRKNAARIQQLLPIILLTLLYVLL